MRLFQTIAYSGTIWLVSCLINGIFSGLYVMSFCNEYKDMSPLLLATVFSMVFSVPGIFLFWLLFFVGVVQERRGQSLFRYTLTAAFGCAVLSGVVSSVILYGLFKAHVFIIAIIGLMAAMVSLFIHRRTIIDIQE